jgi:RNA polymerase sigma factor (sigma-70 family)
MTIYGNPVSDKFLRMLHQHKGIIWKIAGIYCTGAHEREDLVQEITIQLWRSFPNYNSRFALSTWVYRIALNTAISFYRKEVKRSETRNAISGSVLQFADTGEAGETEQNLILLNQFITELGEFDRALILLSLEEKPHREIAEILGTSVTNVSTRLARIKLRLKEKFNQHQ